MRHSIPITLSTGVFSSAIFLVSVIVLATLPVSTRANDSPQLSLDRLYADPPLVTPLPEDLMWRPGHETYTYVTTTSSGDQHLVEVDPATGEKRTLIASNQLRLRRDDPGELPPLTNIVYRPDGEALLLSAGEELFICDLTTALVTRLKTGAGTEEHMLFASDGRRLGYVRENNLFAYDLDLQRELQLTKTGSDSFVNGVFDWIYWEELANRSGRAFAWSPDGSVILWLSLDDSATPEFHHVDYLDTHSKVKSQRYPKVGDPAPLPKLNLMIFDAEFKVTKNLGVPFGQPYPFVPRFGFEKDGAAIWYQEINHLQKRLRLMRMPLPGQGTKPVLVETDPYWVEPMGMMEFLADGALLWGSRRSGYMHLYRIDSDSTATDLTPDESDVTDLLGVRGNYAWYQAARPDPTQRRLYRLDLTDGTSLELTSDPGTHSGELSPEGNWLLVTSSTFARPGHVDLYPSGGGSPKVVADSQSEELAGYKLAARRLITVTASDGTELNASLLTPPDFAEGKRYPVVVYVYGGPHAQVVTDSWGRYVHLFHFWLASQGYLVFSLDNRGSGGRGREFEGAVDGRLGSSQLPDQLAGVNWLREQAYVDPDRIAIWGWSYGGYMTCYALTRAPGTFAAGIAVAPLTDWQLYDSVYTERYMGFPESNPEGYRDASVLEKAADLVDPLLVIHGTGDHNVHLQNTLQLADRLWRAGRTFDLVLFPNQEHGIKDPGATEQVFRRIAAHLTEHIGTRKK